MIKIAIVRHLKYFEQHERPHADRFFREKFLALGKLCNETCDIGYKVLWQGAPDEVAPAD